MSSDHSFGEKHGILALEMLNFELSACNQEAETKSKAFYWPQDDFCQPGSNKEGESTLCHSKREFLNLVGSVTLLQVGGLDDADGLFQLCVFRISHLWRISNISTVTYRDFLSFFFPGDFLDKTT